VHEGGLCPRHQSQRQHDVDARRESSSARGYKWRWRNYRRAWLRAHPLCGDRVDGRSTEHSECAQAHRVSAATDVDHIAPHRGDEQLFWDARNHQSLCHACHSAKTAREDGGFGNRGRGRPISGD
jgi:5-methylcytosine-specific restriction protein A